MAEKKIVIDIAFNAADAATSLKEVKTSLKELKNIQLEFGEGTEEYTKAAVKIGKLKDTLADANDTARVLTGNVAENLTGAFSRVASAGIGAFQAVEGAQAVFGVENEDLQKQMVKLQGLLNLSQGVKEFANIGQSAKDFKTVLVALVPSLFAQTAATEGAAVAQTGLNAAMRANPIGAIITVLTLLVGAIALFSSSTDDATESQELNTEEIEKAKKSEEDYKKSLDDTNSSLDDRIKKLDDELAVLGKNGTEKERILAQQDADNRKRELLADKNVTDGLAALQRLETLRALGYLRTTSEFIELKKLESSELVKIGLKAQKDLAKIEQLKVGNITEINKQAAEESQKTRDEAKKKAEKERQDTLKQIESEFKAENDADQKRADEEFKILKEKNAKILAEEEKQAAELNALLTKEIEDAADAQAKADNEARRKRIEGREATQKYVQDLSNIFKAQNENLNSNALSFVTTAADAFTVFSELKDKVFKNDTEKFAAYAEATLQLAGSLLNDISNNNKEKIQERLDDLNSSTDEELAVLKKRKDDGLINEKQFKEGEYRIKLKAFNDEEKLKKQLFEQDKKAKIAQATIAGIQGAIQAYTGAQSLPIPPPGPQIIGGIAAAAVLAFTAKNIAKIQSTQYKGGTAPSAPDSGGDVNLPTPNTNAQPTPSPQLLGFGDTGQNNLGTPTSFVRAVVLESDITNAQIRIKNYQTESQL